MSAPRRRVLGVCADDVGLVEGVAETVVALAAEARLSAASCVANAPAWRDAAALLARSKAPLELGLHFNLTEGAPRSGALRAHWPVLPGLARLLALASVRALAAGGDRRGVRRPGRCVRGRPRQEAGVRRWPSARSRAARRARGRSRCDRDLGRAAGRAQHRPAAGPGAGFKRWVIEASGGRALAARPGRARHCPQPRPSRRLRLRHGRLPALDAGLARRRARRRRLAVLPSLRGRRRRRRSDRRGAPA